MLFAVVLCCAEQCVRVSECVSTGPVEGILSNVIYCEAGEAGGHRELEHNYTAAKGRVPTFRP